MRLPTVLLACLLVIPALRAEPLPLDHECAGLVKKYLTAVVEQDWKTAADMIISESLERRQRETVGIIKSAPTMTDEAAMLEGDELGAAVKAAEATLAGDKKSVAAEKSAIEADAIAVQSALDALTAERSALVKTIEPSALATFERVAKGRNGIGLARAVDGLCGACRVRIRPHLYNEVRKGDQIIQCESCVRILYYVPPPKPAEGETPATPTADSPAQS